MKLLGMFFEAAGRNEKVGSAERTGHFISRRFPFAALEETLEAERVPARQHFGVGESLEAYRTFSDVADLLR